MDPAKTDAMRQAIAARYPALADAPFRIENEGWQSVAVDAGGFIFKFAREAQDAAALAREARLLAVVRRYATLPVPDMIFQDGALPFTRHRRIDGEKLPPERYARLDEDERQRLARDLSGFFAELHAIPAPEIAEAGAAPVEAWLPAGEIERLAMPLLPPGLAAYGKALLAEWTAMPDDPLGTVYGNFDCHVWNVAFDFRSGRLNGVYDFGDSGFGRLHREFVYPCWISRDLTRRIAAEYERLTHLRIDLRRIEVLTAAMRLGEVATLGNDPQWASVVLRNLEEWAGGEPLA